jgi:hypothetical protein
MKIGNYCFGGIVEQCFLNQGQDAEVPRPKVILVAPCVDWREQSKLVLQHYYPTYLEVHSEELYGYWKDLAQDVSSQISRFIVERWGLSLSHFCNFQHICMRLSVLPRCWILLQSYVLLVTVVLIIS